LKDNHEEVLPDQARSPEVRRANELTQFGEDHIRGLFRFSDRESKADVVATVRDEVVGDAEWWKIESHECDHDQDQKTGCSDWTTEDTKGNVPQGV